MRIFVAGASGQVALSLKERASSTSHEVVCQGRPDLDLTDEGSIANALAGNSYDLVVNAAAYTAVDQAEDEESLAHAINGKGAGDLASAAQAIGVPVIHISTDYVFDGVWPEPYTEDIDVSPLGAYGRSKLEGERAVMHGNDDHVILRTAWVYSPFGKNFVKTMLRLAEDRDVVSVVDDQIGSPSSALDIADGILGIATKIEEGRTSWGVYHMGGHGYASWADVAQKVFESSRARGGPFADVTPITTAEFPTKAQRPANSRLNSNKLSETFGVRLPDWQQSVDSCVERLLSN